MQSKSVDYEIMHVHEVCTGPRVNMPSSLHSPQLDWLNAQIYSRQKSSKIIIMGFKPENVYKYCFQLYSSNTTVCSGLNAGKFFAETIPLNIPTIFAIYKHSLDHTIMFPKKAFYYTNLWVEDVLLTLCIDCKGLNSCFQSTILFHRFPVLGLHLN